MSHTKEPWVASGKSSLGNIVIFSGDEKVAEAFSEDAAHRIIVCSTALAGIDNPLEYVQRLEQQVASQQARIDSLMLEYCPDDMTQEQTENWEKHQQPVEHI